MHHYDASAQSKWAGIANWVVEQAKIVKLVASGIDK